MQKPSEMEEAEMNTRLMIFCTILTILLGACAPAATPQPVAQEPRYEAPPVERPAPTQPPLVQEPAYAPTAAPGGNFYQDYGVNPSEQTRRDHLSTFALDVDTASYTVARRYINDGSLPPIEAVRAEEFVNAFEQGYTPPDSAAFTIYADGAPNPFRGDGSYYLRFGVQGYRVPEWERKPLALTFVIDISGSMKKENRLELVKDALRLLVRRLDERDSVTVVVYGTQARLALEPTPGSQVRTILRVIDGLHTEGSTNAEAGLRLGYEYAMYNYDPEASNRVVLCSDGVANTGETDANRLVEMVSGYVAEGIDLTTLGFGLGNFNDVLLERLADNGNGNYAYIDTLDEAERLFVDDLTSTLQVIAYDAKVQVDFNQDVVHKYRLIGYENREISDQDFRDDSVDAGEVGAGHTATAIYQVWLVPGAEGRIATIQLRWQDADTREIKEINGNFNSWDLYASFYDGDAYFQNAVLVGAFAEILRASPYTDANLEMVAQMADDVARRLPEELPVQEFADLAWQAARLQR
jgi:Ca-activated chloride channel family protein